MSNLSERMLEAADALDELNQAHSHVHCAPWCTDGDGHPGCAARADQNCWGVMQKVILGLEDGAPALPLGPSISSDAPGISVYAYQQWHGRPHVRVNIFREHKIECLSVDVDLDATAAEARELAAVLIAVADTIDQTSATQEVSQ